MAYLPNNPNGVNVAPSANTKPRDGFWGERQVTWLKVEGMYTYGGTQYDDAFEKPWTINGYAEMVSNVIEDRGTILGMYNDQPAPLGSGPVDGTGLGGTLYVALGYAAGFFAPGSILEGTVSTVGGPITFVGSVPHPDQENNPGVMIPFVDPVSAGIITDVLAKYPHVPASLTITVGNGFAVL